MGTLHLKIFLWCKMRLIGGESQENILKSWMHVVSSVAWLHGSVVFSSGVVACAPGMIQWLRNKQTIWPLLDMVKFEFLFRKYFTPLHCADYSRRCLVTFILLSMTSTFISLGMQLQPSFSSIIQRGNEPWLYIPPPPAKEVHKSP